MLGRDQHNLRRRGKGIDNANDRGPHDSQRRGPCLVDNGGSSATARADENSFLARVHAAGMPLTDEKALKLGNATCTDIGNGIAMSAILESNNPAAGSSPILSPSQNWELFSSAVSELCPQFQTGY